MTRTGPLTIAALLVLPCMAGADGVSQMGIAGVYAAAGTNGDGSHYRAIVIIRKHEDAFRVQWIFPSRHPVAGLGILDGNVLAVSYFGSPPAIALYQVDGDRLIGRWTMMGGGGRLSFETLTRIPEHRVPEPSRDSRDTPALQL